jgi:hypothetical protein
VFFRTSDDGQSSKTQSSRGTEKFTAESSLAVPARPSVKGNLERRLSVGLFEEGKTFVSGLFWIMNRGKNINTAFIAFRRKLLMWREKEYCQLK